ncbi:hypothetical protein DIPPA_26922 [Diplonema papillatum]|nr:hypothetical protein DIPPA_26922 [Diplonema papillatum]
MSWTTLLYIAGASAIGVVVLGVALLVQRSRWEGKTQRRETLRHQKRRLAEKQPDIPLIMQKPADRLIGEMEGYDDDAKRPAHFCSEEHPHTLFSAYSGLARVVGTHGVVARKDAGVASGFLCVVPAGSVVSIRKVQGSRALLDYPKICWVSTVSRSSDMLLTMTPSLAPYAQGAGPVSVVNNSGALIRMSYDTTSPEVGRALSGESVEAQYRINNRIRVSFPVLGWVSVVSEAGTDVLSSADLVRNAKGTPQSPTFLHASMYTRKFTNLSDTAPNMEAAGSFLEADTPEMMFADSPR